MRLATAPLLIALISAVGAAAASRTAKPVTPVVKPVKPGFSRAFVIAPPAARDLIPVQLGFSPSDFAVAGFGAADEDDPANSVGVLSLQQPSGGFGSARTVPSSQQVLALGYRGDKLELLTGSSVGTRPCCSQVQAVSVGGAFGSRHTVIGNLAGPALARLVAVKQRLLAAVATEHGVWVAQTDTRGHFGPTRDLVAATSWPQSLDATGLSNDRTVVIWTAKPSQYAPGPTEIDFAQGSPATLPQGPAIAVAVAPTHTVDEIAVAARKSVPTVAWIESWYDRAGVFQTQAYTADLAGRRRPQRISAPGEQASGLALAAGADGGQVLAYRACSRSGNCLIRAALRRAGRFATAVTLGPIDSTQLPAVAQSGAGASLVGWIHNGSVRAAVALPGSARLQAPKTVSSTGFAADLALAFAPSGTRALVAWTQGTLNQSLVGASYGLPAGRHH